MAGEQDAITPVLDPQDELGQLRARLSDRYLVHLPMVTCHSYVLYRQYRTVGVKGLVDWRPDLERSFWTLWSASTVSGLGDGLRVTTIPLLAASWSSSPGVLGMVTAAGFAPWALFGLLAGALSDRLDRRALMWRVDLARAVVMAVLTVGVLTGRVGIPVLVIVVFALGTAQCLFDSSAVSLLPTIVTADRLARANSLLTTSQTLTSDLAGPVIAGTIFALGAALPLGVNAFSFLLAAVLVATLPSAARTSTIMTAPPVNSLVHDVREGLTTVIRDPALRALIGLSAALGAVSGAVIALLVLYVRLTLHQDSRTYGILLALFAVGAVGGAVIAPGLIRRHSSTRLVTAVLLIAAASLAGLGLTSHSGVAGGFLATFGLSAGLWAVVATTLRQRLTPNRLLGRVTSAAFTVVRTTMTLGALLGGLLASHTSIPTVLLVGAATLACCPLAGLTKIKDHPHQ